MPDDVIQYLSVRINGDAIIELRHERKPVLVVPKEEIRSAELTRGSNSARPVLQCVFGGILIALATVPFVYGTALTWLVVVVSLLLAGGWIIVDAVRPVTLLRLRTFRGTKKVAFHGRPDREELEAFLQAAEDKFGYVIDRKL
jgi:hypothetical protein